MHIPLVQLSPTGQAWPQDPQLFGSVLVEAQPEVQHCWPAAQAGWPWQVVEQAELTHALPVGQALPQKPQF